MKRLIAEAMAALLLASGCASSTSRAEGSAEVLRLGVFPNLTHAPAYVALGEGIFDRVLAPTKVKVTYFNSGSDAGTALLSGSIDATYIGPGPAVSLFLQSGEVAVVSGAVSGGASFVVREGAGIRKPADLHGRKIAVPGIGNTQDVALRTWLHEHGLKAKDEGGDVSIAAVDNPELLQLFQGGRVDGAWEPEPYPSLLIAEGVAEPFVDEASLWQGGRFVTTNLLINTTYMEAHPDVVRRLVRANVEAIRAIHDDPEGAKAAAQAGLMRAGAPSLDQSVVDAAWSKLTFTWDPLTATLRKDAEDAYALGYLEQDPKDILGIYRLQDLNAVLRAVGEPPVEVP
ncbi:MAG: ABC transporter substrate-binding protein [Actinobacteria bacterium]|nr:ABC transporter substrate-binding protein [Actinomycetota bacterium]